MARNSTLAKISEGRYRFQPIPGAAPEGKGGKVSNYPPMKIVYIYIPSSVKSRIAVDLHQNNSAGKR